jgi:hypothetical protein
MTAAQLKCSWEHTGSCYIWLAFYHFLCIRQVQCKHIITKKGLGLERSVRRGGAVTKECWRLTAGVPILLPLDTDQGEFVERTQWNTSHIPELKTNGLNVAKGQRNSTYRMLMDCLSTETEIKYHIYWRVVKMWTKLNRLKIIPLKVWCM